MTKKKKINLSELVNNYKTKYKEGFIKSEIDELLKQFPDINMDKFNNAMMGNTCIVRDNQTIIYHCDIEKSLRCGIENRNLTVFEWD